MSTYKVTLSYVGASYHGWQIQPEPHKTIQGELNKVLSTLVKNEDSVLSLGSGRTDAGVHAWGQVVKVTLPFFIEPQSLMKGANTLLPKDIRILNCEECEDSFHPILNAKSKEYRYLIYEGENLPPFLDSRVTLAKPGLDWDSIEEALTHFVGEKDFINFSTKGTPVKTTVRTIFKASLRKSSIQDFGGMSMTHESLREIHLVGNGFLKQMVRLIVGALLDIGRGKRNASELDEYFCGEKSHKFAAVSEAAGLYLDKVNY